jgi:hypothetical protein
MKYRVALFLCALFLPCLTFASVRINEVAWMGTTSSQYGEWIELYNDSTTDVSLAGWKLYKTGDELLFTLSKTIAANGYLVIQRTTATAPATVANSNDESGPFSNGGLNNSGEDLTLKDDSGNVIDSLSFSSGWPAGDSSTKDTMQLNSGQWITAPGTPDAPNATVADASATKTTDSDSPSGDDSQSAATDTASDSTDTTSSASTGETSSGSSKHVTLKVIPPDPKLSITADKTIFQGNTITFTPKLTGADPAKAQQGYYYWNTGDGMTYLQTVLAPISHIYHYVGNYTVSLSYFDSMNASQSAAQVTAAINVTTPSLEVAVIDGGAAIKISNVTSQDTNIGGWPIHTDEGDRALPPMTIIASKSDITVNAPSLGLDAIKNPSIDIPK